MIFKAIGIKRYDRYLNRNYLLIYINNEKYVVIADSVYHFAGVKSINVTAK